MEKYFIGIDVDKKTFKVCFVLRDPNLQKKIKGTKTFSNSKVGFSEFSLWCKAKSKVLKLKESYIMEATGVYHEHLAHYLHSKKKEVHIVLPLRSKRYLQSLGFRSKNDQIDAKGLAIMGSEQSLDLWEPGETDYLKLRSITRQIEALQNHKTAFSNQLEAINHSAVIDITVTRSLKSIIKNLNQQITKLEIKVKESVENSVLLKEKFKLFNTLKGIGLMTFAVIVAETNGFILFKNQRQLICYTGYDIIENQSGAKAGKTRMSKKGNTHIRRILHLSAFSAVRNDVTVFRSLYERVYERTSIKMKGYVAVQRKLLVTMYSLWKKDEAFNPNFQASGIKETVFSGTSLEVKTAESKDSAALDRLQCNQSPKAFFLTS